MEEDKLKNALVIPSASGFQINCKLCGFEARDNLSEKVKRVLMNLKATDQYESQRVWKLYKFEKARVIIYFMGHDCEVETQRNN